MLVGIGWLDPGAFKRWKQGQIDYLEAAVQTNLPRISVAMKLLRSWAGRAGPNPEQDALCRADAVPGDVALQQER